MNKFLPIVSILGLTAILGGCSSNMNVKKGAILNNLNSFKEDFYNYTQLSTDKTVKTSLNKYKLSLETPEDDNITSLNEENVNNNEILDKTSNINENNELQTTDEVIDETYNSETNLNLETKQEEISTLYSLSSDIEDSCNEFCQLKENITNAIIETQNLITKFQQKEIELTPEQKIFITEQSMQLKNLGRQLSNITTELSLNLSDLNQIVSLNNENFDSLSLKYLVVLDNLINGNEMLQTGMQSLNLINQMFNMSNNNMPSNNQGRILYGFKKNNNPPVIKDYYINENGEIIENKQENTTDSNENLNNLDNLDANNTEPVSNDNDNNDNKNIDTYKNSILTSNIDTYQTNNPPKNIDSFFNTALLDNEFMYGNGGYGYGTNNGFYGNNPYMRNYYQYEQNRTTDSVNNNNNTQSIEQSTEKTDNKKTNNKKKKFNLKKNIDTYQDENEPHIKVKLNKIKNGISNFFTGFKKADLSEKTENPIYKFEN